MKRRVAALCLATIAMIIEGILPLSSRPVDITTKPCTNELVKSTRVIESHLIYIINPYKSLFQNPSSDRIILSNNTGGDEAIIVLDARRATGCKNDEVVRASSTVDISNVLSSSDCNDVYVFSDENAMAFRTANWRDEPGDKLKIVLTPMLQVPTTVWVMRGPFDKSLKQVNTEFARVKHLYNTMNCGIDFSTPVINNATANPRTRDLLNANCDKANNLRAQIGFTDKRLNIYYLNNPGAAGYWCGNYTIIVSSQQTVETLAHEIGHAFSLDHAESLGNNNIMYGGGEVVRNYFTIGQCFRCNINKTSILNANGVRSGEARDCPDSNAPDSCLKLELYVKEK